MGNVNDLHELQTRSVFRGHAVPLAPTADAWRLFAPTADAWRLFAPTADAQRLSRLRRTHSVSRAYGGRTASLAPTADAQRLFAPTADAQRLFAPTAFPKKANREEFAFRSIWEGPTEASENFHTGKNYSPTTCEK